MPLFEYHCPDCKSTFEKILSKPEPALPCPTCGKPALRSVSTFATTPSGPVAGGCSAPGGSGFS